MAEVLHAKVAGGWLLHTLLPDLDFFVVFSSLGALLGQPGQADLCRGQRLCGRIGRAAPASRLQRIEHQLGTLVGDRLCGRHRWAAGDPGTGRQGIGALDPAQGLDILAKLLAGRSSGQVAMLPAVPATLEEHELPYLYANCKRLLPLLLQRSKPVTRRLPACVRRCWPWSLCSAVRGIGHPTATGRGTGAADASCSRGFRHTLGSLGLDSLMAMELRNRLELGLDIRLRQPYLEYPTIHELVPYLAERMDVPLEAAGTAVQARTDEVDETRPVERKASGSASLDDLLADIETLSDEDAWLPLRPHNPCQKRRTNYLCSRVQASYTIYRPQNWRCWPSRPTRRLKKCCTRSRSP